VRILALDVGTSRTKLGVYDGELRRHQLASRVSRAVGGDGTVDLALLGADVAALLAETGPYSEIDAVGITTIFGHVFLDATGKAVTAGWGWNHGVARTEAKEIDTFCRERRLEAGRPVTPELLAPRLLWLRRNRPELFGRITRVIGIKDYLLREFTGETLTDPSQRDYAVLLPEVVSHVLGPAVSPGLLPPEVPGHFRAGTVSAVAAQTFGIAEGTPVAVGSSDGTAAMYGAGVLAGGVVATVSGSTDVCMVLDGDGNRRGTLRSGMNPGPGNVQPAGEGEARHLVCNRGMINGTRLRGGSTGASGEAVRWWRDITGATASSGRGWPTIPPGAEGVRVAPGFAGERAPFFRGDVGTIDGLTVRHGMDHIIRAFHEANAYRLARLTELIVASSTSATRMILGGGTGVDGEAGAIDAIRAAVVPLPLYRADDEHLSLRGAAMFAIVAAHASAEGAWGKDGGEEGDFPDAEARDGLLRQLSEMVAARATPVAGDAVTRKSYGELYRRWLAWMESILPPGDARRGSATGEADGGFGE
jgi:sugar (pentulose or hexulose) kinase